MAAKKAKKATKARASSKRVAKRSTRKAPKKTHRHQVVHWEIQSQNPRILHRFYADAFGWEVDANNPMEYGMVASGGRAGIDGGIGGSQAPGSRVVVYTAVPSIPPVLKRIESLGGKTILPRTDVGPVIMALYEDL
jgi:predicted enzyme related to lactoylglutathione lyase